MAMASKKQKILPLATCNSFGQPIGLALGSNVSEWTSPGAPQHQVLEGRTCRLEPLKAEQHAQQLFDSFHTAERDDDKLWTYLPYGPFGSLEEYSSYMQLHWQGTDPLFFAIVDVATAKAIGVAAYLRITPSHGVIEIGHLFFSPSLQKTTAATEALYLMMKTVFDLGYRRCEWKLDALNAPSFEAAQRLGFKFEGIFRNHVVYKGRSRDTAWLSVTDDDWTEVGHALATWLHSQNFDANGNQILSLAEVREARQTTCLNASS